MTSKYTNRNRATVEAYTIQYIHGLETWDACSHSPWGTLCQTEY